MRRNAIVLAALLVLAGCGRKSAAPDADQKPEVKQQTADSEDGSLHLDGDAQSRAQLKTATLSSRTIGGSIIAYGTLEENRSTSYIARASSPGTVQSVPETPWPVVGQALQVGKLFGVLQPRLAPAERIALLQQLETARADVSGSTASVSAARAAYDRAKELNADRKNFSDRALQEAEARLRSEQAHLDAATRTVRVLQNSLNSTGQVTGSQRLVAERSGDVVEVLAQPGELVEQGAPILRMTRLDRLLARISLPIGTQLSLQMKTAEIVPSGYEDQPPVRGTRLGFAPATDPRVQAASLLFRLDRNRFDLRPGISVTAYLSVPGKSSAGLVIPQSAVVRYAGRSSVFVQTGPETFVRQEISIDRPARDGYVVNAGFRPGDRIVIVGAEALLSEEFKSKLHTDED
jgi:RND family efflux transporter MFP subunit